MTALPGHAGGAIWPPEPLLPLLPFTLAATLFCALLNAFLTLLPDADWLVRLPRQEDRMLLEERTSPLQLQMRTISALR